MSHVLNNRPEGDSLTAGQERSVKAAGLQKQIPSSYSVMKFKNLLTTHPRDLNIPVTHTG